MPQHLRNLHLDDAELQVQCDRYSGKHYSSSIAQLQAVALSAQGTPAWLLARRNKITGSVAGKVLKSPMTASTDHGTVVASITNPNSFNSTKAMKAGLKREVITVAETIWFLGEILSENISSMHDVELWTCEKNQFLALSVDHMLQYTLGSVHLARAAPRNQLMTCDLKTLLHWKSSIMYQRLAQNSLHPQTLSTTSSWGKLTAPPAYY